MSTENQYDHEENSYGSNRFASESRPGTSSRRRPAQGRRRGKGPQSVNGMHKRRRRKMSW
ncbi:MAG: hypothetical protein AAF805_08830 [Planctomycetota bacterium]